jgi:apolipoprotein N-acyltransferase
MVRRYFPDYSEVVTILPILYLWVALQTINIYELIPMALKRTRLLLASTLIALAGVAAIYGVGVLRGWPISGFAWGFVASRALMLTAHFVISVVLTNRYEGERRKSSLESIDDSTHLIR